MNITGIICEYNPFHNGHKYHIDMTRKTCGSDCVVAVMSGPFTQRGIPAITDKYSRTLMALENGCDIVLELPVRYATASAEGFACGAVNTLDATGIVNSLCFGSESDDLSSYEKAVEILEDEPYSFKKSVATQIKNGVSYPVARQNALSEAGVDDISYSPNNILAMEYLRACKNTDIKAFSIKRTGDADHNDITLPDDPDNICSAAAIREMILDGDANDHNTNGNISECNKSEGSLIDCIIPESIKHFLPQNIIDKYDSLLAHPMSTEHFSLVLLTSLLANRQVLSSYLDISEDMAKRINNHLGEYRDWDSFVKLIKTKQYTFTRIQRGLLHCMLNIKKPDYVNPSNQISNNTNNNLSDKYPIPYIRILGFRKSSTDVVKALKEKSSVPVITKPSEGKLLKSVDSLGYEMFVEDSHAHELYSLTRAITYGLDEGVQTNYIIL